MASKYLTPDNKHIFSTSQNGTVPKPTAEDANKYLKGDGTWSGGGGGGASALADLDDVSFSNLQNGQVPKYNSTTQKWENANESGGGGTVTDVEVDGVSVVNQQGVAEIVMPTPPTIPVINVKVNGTSVVDSNKEAQIKSYKEVTQSEYNALPDSKLTDGILYAIKDVGGSDGFPPLIYSDEEREVGVWRDGKPLYQRTYVTQNATVNSVVTMADLTSLNIDTVVDYYGEYNRYVSGTSDNIIYKFNSYQSSTINNWLRVLNKNTLQYQINQNSSAESTSYQAVTILYTKITDTAGSGIWTTQGALAHHYSTDEHIIGTWIDGKPIYERTFNNLSVAISGTSWIDISSINTTGWGIVIKGMARRSDNNKIYTELVEYLAENGVLRVRKDYSQSADITINLITVQYTKTTD